ncbi:hypothetical protein A3E17_03405 [Candidatus Amesbacteria bacterium RIFCSPHIGHO2_12_FULL_48_14]|uniref:Plasmid stabilization protein n=1 Tax=Candidatus Amesbacteria bacterium RIFCSPHIGHO2_12_FULL_48_14 TaxID=1797257 RepID=A0A1F4ZE11_9BACT|nr:MAG: hypothetical protein A3E17_03405 [Candidatus Amesbacteria bacterium RIFCSPHIGHO2_12_FULL_48_14]
MEVEFSSHFLDQAKKLTQKEKEVLAEKVELFRKNPRDPRLKTHALTGKLKGSFSFSVTYSKRAIFVLSGNTAIFAEMGTHDHVYR